MENLSAPTRRTIMMWSDTQVNRTSFENIKNGKSSQTYANAIKVRDKISGKFIPLDLNKTYKIGLTDKYVNKEGLAEIKKLEIKSFPQI